MNKTIKSNSSVSIRTITSKDGRFIVGIKTVSEDPITVQLILLQPPNTISVLDSLSPEELLAVRDFVGSVADNLAEKGVRIVK